MKNRLAEILTPLSQTIYELVAAVPMWAVQSIIFGVLGLLALWIILMQPQLPEKTEGEKGFSWRDLRFFALFVLALQVVLYLVF